ncbi:MAG: Ig-like domain-containing protein [Paracoccaceae bacterium]
MSYDISGLPAGLDYDPDTGVISGTIDNSASQGGSGGVYTVEVTASDGTLTATQSFTYTVENPAPDAANDTGATDEDVPLVVDAAAGLLANDSDPDGDDLAVTGFSVNGTTYAAGETAGIAGVGELTIYATGAYDFTPAENFNGPVPQVTYTISDGEGGPGHRHPRPRRHRAERSPEIDTIAGVEVFEAGLGPRTGDRAGDEAIGSGEIADGDPDNDSDTSETTTGSITFTAEEGFCRPRRRRRSGGRRNRQRGGPPGPAHDHLARRERRGDHLQLHAQRQCRPLGRVGRGPVRDRDRRWDGMSATGVLTVTVHDDAPQDFTAQPMLFSNEGSATGSGALNFYESIGADGGTAVFSGITDGETLLLTDGTAVTSGGAPVQLYGDGTRRAGRAGRQWRRDVHGRLPLTLHPNGSVEADDAYTFELFRALDDGSARSLTDVQFKGTNVDYRVLQDAMGADDDVLFSAAASYSPADGYGAVDTVNASLQPVRGRHRSDPVERRSVPHGLRQRRHRRHHLCLRRPL